MTDATPRPARLLVVEDDADIRETLSELLQEAGYAVESAADGLIALDKLRDAPAPDLVLLDMMLPNLDGHGVLEAMRKTPAWAQLKVVAISATEVTQPLGVRAFVKKPFDPARLLKLIAETIEPSDQG